MRLYSFVLSLLLIVYTAPLMAQGDDALSIAAEKLEARDHPGAIDAYSQVLKSQPDNVEALSGIIRAYILADNIREAQRFIERAIKAHPTNPEFFLRRGIVNNIRGQFRRAIEDFDRAISLSSGQEAVAPLVNRGVSYLREENYQRALQDFAAAIELNPLSSAALSQHGFTNYRLGNYQDAVSDFNLALEVDPDNAMSYYNRGMSHLRMGNQRRACSDFHQSCSRGNMNACRMIMGECQGVPLE